MEGQLTNPNNTYWATEEPDKLVSKLEEKWKKYQKHLKGSVYWNRVIRNISYWHGIFFDRSLDILNMEISLIGESGEQIGYSINHFRSLLEHIFQFAAGDKIALKCRAVNSDNKSLAQARIGTSVLDYYQREKELENYLRTAAIHALIFAQGYILHEWDEDGGNDIEERIPAIMPQDQLNTGITTEIEGNPLPTPIAPVTKKEGDIKFTNPTIKDICWDISRPWEQCQWVIVKELRNKWDLVKLFPEYEEDLLSINEEDMETLSYYKGLSKVTEEDFIPTYKFYHKKTPAVKTGRFMYFVKDQALIDTVLPYEDLPLSRMTGGEWIEQGTGWTPAFSLQAPQEMLNGELSAVLTNHAAFAAQGVWVPPGSEHLRILSTKKGPRVYTSSTKPEPLNFLVSSPQLPEFAKQIITDMQLVSGVAGATRGVPEAGVTAGNALALLDAKSIQANSAYVHSFHRFCENVGTNTIRILRKYCNNKRLITVMGKSNEPESQYFIGSDLESIDRVVVDTVNPLSKTIAGKDAKAKDLISIGAIRNVEQYNQVYETGNLEPMFEAERAQLSLIREENEKMLAGVAPIVLDTDNHSLHIREHQPILSNDKNRKDPNIMLIANAHTMDHVGRLMIPAVRFFQQIMGYQLPMPEPGMLPMQPPNMAPQGQGNELPPPELKQGVAPIKLPNQASPPAQNPVVIP